MPSLHETTEFVLNPAEKNRGFWPLHAVLTPYLKEKEAGGYLSKGVDKELAKLTELMRYATMTANEDETVWILEQSALVLKTIVEITNAPFKVKVILKESLKEDKGREEFVLTRKEAVDISTNVVQLHPQADA